ncbi:hypothetical protein [Priestia flexa]|uniref:hypothetical protein n=1 Tax=Priestia flexa TaxID=86664 RepID=UPI00047433E5|nr:hypothetical protein [Priestia flexa]
MSKENWHKGYKEVKNVIHNDIGVTKEEVLDIFRQIAKDEIQQIVSDNKPFIYECIRGVVRSEMTNAVSDHSYPRIRKNIWGYTNENSFKDFLTGVMKEEIVDSLRDQFEINLNIDKK